MYRVAVVLITLIAFFSTSQLASIPTAIEAYSPDLRSCNGFGYEIPGQVQTQHGWLRPAFQDEFTLTIWVDELRADVLNNYRVEYEEMHPGVTLEIVTYSLNDLRGLFLTAVASGDAPDILLGRHEWIGEFSAAGLLQVFDLGEQTGNFTGVSKRCWACDLMSSYGMPITIESAAFIRNLEMVPEMPASWEEVRDISAELVESGADAGFIIPQADPYFFFGVQTAFGGNLFAYSEENGYDSEEVLLGSEGSITAGQWYQEMINDGLMPSVDYTTAVDLFLNGQAGMIIAGPWLLETLAASDISYEVTGLPGGGQPFVSALGFMISSSSEHADDARDFLVNFLAREDIMAAFVAGDYRLSAYLPVLENEENSVRAVFAEVASSGFPYPSFTNMGEVYSAWATALQKIANNEATPEDAFAEATGIIQEVMAGE